MAGKKKVLYIITKSNFGGAQRYVYDMATSLPRERFEVAVAFGGSGVLKEMLHKAKIRAIPIKNLERDINIKNEISVFWSLFNLFRNERPDVIHLNSSKIGGLGAFAGRLYNFLNFILHLLQPATCNLQPARIIFTAHGWAFREDRPFREKITIKFLSWLTVILSHKIITVSACDFADSPRLFAVNKIIMIHNGISEFRQSAKNTARKRFSDINPALIGHENSIWIGSTSELHKNKGLDFLIRAFKEVHSIHIETICVIASTGEEKDRLMKLSSELKIEDYVFLTGFIPNVREMIKAFDIFTMPSRKEGLPYGLLEAGFSGLPIIATNVGGIPEIVEDMKTGILVRPRNPEEIARALMYCINNKKKSAEFSKNIKEKIIQKFSLDEMSAKTIKLYS